MTDARSYHPAAETDAENIGNPVTLGDDVGLHGYCFKCPCRGTDTSQATVHVCGEGRKKAAGLHLLCYVHFRDGSRVVPVTLPNGQNQERGLLSQAMWPNGQSQ